MYENVERLIFEKKLKKSDIAHEVGITYNTLLLKLSGKYKFTLDEAVALRNILDPDMPIEEMFKTEYIPA